MLIRKLNQNEEPPMELLLLADPSRQLVEANLRKGECYISEYDGQIIGVYVLLPKTQQTVELVNIAVAESHQGRGIGKKLIQNAIETAKRMGFKTIEVGTGNSSIGQLALYQKCGFRIIDIDKDFFIRSYTEAIFENGIQCRDMIRLSKDI